MKRFVFLGDSITDCYHSFDPENLGEGYVRLIHEQLCASDSDIQIINKGVDGFTLPALKRLWQQQSGTLSPDLLTILIGINDIGVIQNTGIDSEFALAEFNLRYKTLLEDIRKSYSGPIIIMEPFLFPYPEKYKIWFENLKTMNQNIKITAAEFDLTYVPLWDSLLQTANIFGYDAITIDGIHLTLKGHSIITDKWVAAYKKTWLCK